MIQALGFYMGAFGLLGLGLGFWTLQRRVTVLERFVIGLADENVLRVEEWIDVRRALRGDPPRPTSAQCTCSTDAMNMCPFCRAAKRSTSAKTGDP